MNKQYDDLLKRVEFLETERVLIWKSMLRGDENLRKYLAQIFEANKDQDEMAGKLSNILHDRIDELELKIVKGDE